MAPEERQVADYVVASGVDHIFRAERLLREMRSRDGGSLRLLAFQVQDAMRDLIAHIDGQDHG